MTDLIIYGPAASSYVRTARMTCAEKHLSHRLAPVELASDEHRARHPWSRVPVLRDGDVQLFETSAITRYLDERGSGTRLVPAGLAERARMEQWISAINCYIYDHVVRKYALAGYIVPKLRGTTPDRAAVEANLADMQRDLELLDAAYATTPYLAGAELSLADLFVAPIVATIAGLPESSEVLARTRHLARAFETLQQRPSFAVAHAGLA